MFLNVSDPLFPGDPGTFIKGTKASEKSFKIYQMLSPEKIKEKRLWRLLAY